MPPPSMPAPRRQLRLTVVAAGLVVLAGAGVALILDAPQSSGAPVTMSVDSAPPPAGPATTAAPPTTGAPAPLAAPAPPPTTAAPVTVPSAARTPASPPPTSPPRPRPTPPPAAPRPAAAAAPDSGAQLRQVQAIADTSGWDWRSVHVNFRIGFDPAACCHWGVYDPADHKTIWIGPTAFGDDTRLRYVVLHELGHAWQWHTHRLKKLEADMAPWGYSDIDALEAGADCIATDWGASASMGHYWVCPPDAQALMARRLAGQWK